MSRLEIAQILHTVGYLAMAIAIVSTPFLGFNWIKYTAAKKREKDSGGIFIASFPSKSVGFFVCSVIACIICGTIITYISTNATADFLNSLSGEYSVKINNVPAENPGQIVAELKRFDDIMAHHSYPTTTIQVEIESSKGRLILDLRRDSNIPAEYWVYYPAFSDMKEIGRINTAIFARY